MTALRLGNEREDAADQRWCGAAGSLKRRLLLAIAIGVHGHWSISWATHVAPTARSHFHDWSGPVGRRQIGRTGTAALCQGRKSSPRSVRATGCTVATTSVEQTPNDCLRRAGPN